MRQRDGGELRERRLMTTRERRWNTVNYALIVAVAMLLFWNVLRFVQEREDKEAAQSNAVTLAEQVRAACEDPTVGEFHELDPICVQAEDIVENPTAPIATGLTATQVQIALVDFCASHDDCRGKEGDPGVSPPPLPLNQAQVNAAVATYCTEHLEDCRSIIPGLTGDPGQDGQPGADAPSPTQEQVNAAVATFCTVNPDVCRSLIPGPAGSVCPDGYQQIEFIIDESPPVGLPVGTYLICSKL